jgi:hypothetical protein
MNNLLIALAIFVLSIYRTDAIPQRMQYLPNSAKFGCKICHDLDGEYEKLNPFGEATVEFIDGNKVDWGKELGELDSDSDGFTNAEELLDPDCTWQKGDPNPGNYEDASHPGDSTSKPKLNSVFEFSDHEIKITNTSENSIEIHLDLIQISDVQVSVFDIEGKLLFGESHDNVGSLDIILNFASPGNSISRGIYFVHIRACKKGYLRKIIL